MDKQTMGSRVADIDRCSPDAAQKPTSVGSQTLLDLFDCRAQTLDDLDWVRSVMMQAADAAGATVIETVFHQFSPWGISGVVVIAESHLAIHIWPETRYAAVDVFTCGDSVCMDRASIFLVSAFACDHPVKRVFLRGERPARGV